MADKSCRKIVAAARRGSRLLSAAVAGGAVLALGQGCSRSVRPAPVPADSVTDWTLSTTRAGRPIDAYLPSSGVGQIVGASGSVTARYFSGQYQKNGSIVGSPGARSAVAPGSGGYTQTLDIKNGVLTTSAAGKTSTVRGSVEGYSGWNAFWNDSDIEIDGDPEAQRAVRAELFYLAGSATTSTSIAPFGLSSDGYKGHIFWDAETWMMPALIAQHPQLARGIVLYRCQRLAQAEANAAADHLPGAEFPWESAATGREEAPAEFAQERHITADVALAAWQYYLWTGDKHYLRAQGWPVLRECAEYWAARANKGADGKYHILRVIGPDETSGVVDDDAWTNAAAAQALRDASSAASALGQPAEPSWSTIASGMTLLRAAHSGMLLEHAGAGENLQAKQADTQLLIYPLDLPMPPAQASGLLAFVQSHTISVGPAMTSSINALIAARLGMGLESLQLFQASYQPFLRRPWHAFSEKRTRDSVYFCTGMGGCLQTVLYGFAGLNVTSGSAPGRGKLLERVGDASLYADPHLPPGWSGLTVRGVKFRGREIDVALKAGNTVTAVPRNAVGVGN